MTDAPRRLIPSGTFVQGDDHAYPEEAPARSVDVAAFAIDVHPVTNAQFAAFVAATGWSTRAESAGGSVFVAPDAPLDLADPSAWWRHDTAATWRCPDGRSSIDTERADHPVVTVSHADALAYAAWAGGRLPTEAEWEWAASAGQTLPDTWPLADDGMLLANVWLGEFPWRSIRRDAPGTTPVGSFPPNQLGLYDMLGQVWELTAAPWIERRDGGSSASDTTCCGPVAGTEAVVAKGGSYLCAANYCRRYRPSARLRHEVTAAACHVGFRCAYDLGTGHHDG